MRLPERLDTQPEVTAHAASVEVAQVYEEF